MPSAKHHRLDLPSPELGRHPFFELKQAAVQKWLETLPRANLGETTRQLYLATRLLNQVQCPAATRLQILETLRPQIHVALTGMQKHFLKKPVPVGDQANQVARLCDQLNQQLATGYGLVANELCESTSGNRDTLALALHRALAEYSNLLLRKYQLYTTPATSFWHDLHTLFAMALNGRVAQQKLKDKILGDGTVQAVYLRPLMLAAANPHQLSQTQLQAIYDQLPGWSSHIRIQASKLSSCLLVFNPDSDAPPIYRELRQTLDGDIGIDTRDLCLQLEKLGHHLALRQGPPEKSGLSVNLVKHLLGTWSQMSTRNAPRIERRDKLQVVPGLHAAHFFIAGQVPFQAFSGDTYSKRFIGGNPFMGRARDIWSEAHIKNTSSKDSRTPNPIPDIETIDFTTNHDEDSNKTPGKNYRIYETLMVNASTTGYCINWPLEHSDRLRTGEILALREAQSEHWLLGVFRWIRQVDNWHSQLGVEILADAAEAFAVAPPQGQEQSRRALLLAANDVTGTSLRVLLPAPGFQAGHHVTLKQPNKTIELKLGDELEHTGTYSIFAANILSGADNKHDRERSPDTEEFDTLWKHL